ncbi:unnamed protein product [Symbiodinium sp. CCMP2456]|nr:unnamed protein product [Symbiodinium sp. CCMP2456]
MAAICSPCSYGHDAREAGTVPGVLVDMTSPSGPHLPDNSFSRLQDELQSNMARIHTLLQDQLQSDLARVHERLERLEAHLGLEKRSGAEPNSTSLDEVNLQVVCTDPGKSGSKCNDEKLEEFSEVHFEESVWSIPVVFGLVDVGCFDMLFAGILVFLSLGMQAAFSWILLTDDFIGEGFDAQMDSAKTWRTSVAHDHKHMDLADRSLVSRVCAGDESLILSTNQATLVEHINSFLGLSELDFEPPFFQPGVLLCMLCIIQWSLCVYKELRRIWLQFEATCSVAKSRRTAFLDNSFGSISWFRFCMLLTTYLLRVGIASVLLGGGVLWLARTTSIEELMLNAVALNSILDIDEFVFAGMTPIKIQHAIQNLSPIRIKYSRCRSQLEAFVHFSSLLALICASYFLLLVPLSDTMLAVKMELCGGLQTFVVSYNAETQLVIGLYTAETSDARNLSISESAVQSFKGAPPGTYPEFIRFAATKGLFQQEVSRSMEDEASQYPLCLELDVLNENGNFHTDMTLRPLATMVLNSAAAAVGRAGVQSCQELRAHCDDADGRLLRLVCGDTCGCTDPFSSAWYKVQAQGCSVSCLERRQPKLQNRSCQDLPVDDAWRTFWSSYATVLSSYFGQPVEATQAFSQVNQTLQALGAGGCPVLAQFPRDFLTGTFWCEGTPDLVRSLASICPQTCGCDNPSQVSPLCPPRCRIPNSNASA